MNDPKPNNARTCVVCRTAQPRPALMRLGAQTTSRPSGRGRYVCVARGCLSRLSAKHGGAEDLVALHGLAERRVLETVGLARRMGVLEYGVDNLQDRDLGAGVLIAANDLSARSQRHYKAARPFVSSLCLGRAAGMGAVGLAFIPPSQLAERAAYWLSVWYETERANETTSEVA